MAGSRLSNASNHRGTRVFDVIAFDADDTLWHSEDLYARTQASLRRLLSRYGDADEIDQKLYEIEMRNLPLYGYGIKGFALSMIEAAIELSERQVEADAILQIIHAARDMLNTDVRLLPHVQPTLAALSRSYALMLITKGDLRDQESKLARSGIAQHFRYIEIVSDKTHQTLEAILAKYRIEPSRFLMVGNSLRSDILPVLALGGQAIHIPYHITWAHEVVSQGEEQLHGYWKLDHLGLLPDWIERKARSA
jgi:putative hydrolase of the HAD superfamily